MQFINEIIVHPDGTCTVCGSMAHQLWKAGGYPRSRCSSGNRFYVFGYHELPQGWRWELNGWAKHRGDVPELRHDEVLVNVSEAPYIGTPEGEAQYSKQ